MQEVHSIRGSGSSPFNSGPSATGRADRRIRHNNSNVAAMKCPRCDSSNTKFCYYNNYNLSQPRHFCKGCRRYWTRGGLLRNVPVGGGCRKPKRSNPKPKVEVEKVKRPSNSHSSSENSSTLTGVTTDTEARFEFNNSDGGAWFEQAHLMDSVGGGDCGGIFNGLTNETMSFGFSTHQQQNQWLDERWPRQQKMDGGDGGFNFQGLFDQTVEDELSGLQNRTTVNNGGGFGPLDWQGIGNYNCEQSAFDSTNTVDRAYCNWSQWTTNDQDHSSLYLP